MCSDDVGDVRDGGFGDAGRGRVACQGRLASCSFSLFRLVTTVRYCYCCSSQGDIRH